MTDKQALPHWQKILGFDCESIRRTIRTIRLLRSTPGMKSEIPVEAEALCFWWRQRRVSQAEIRRLKGGAL